MVMGNALWQLIKETDVVTKLILLAVLGMSIVCWALFFYKVIILRMKKRQLASALTHMRTVQSIEQLLETATLFSGTIAGYFVSKNLTFLKSLLEMRVENDGVALSKNQLDCMEQHTHQTFDEMMHNEESYQALFSTSAAVSPLLGLFGTVWGLIHAFIRISEKQSADIATVAPGIAEALITTLAGLVVAIPALCMYSYLNVQIQSVEQQLVLLADRFNNVIQKQLVR